MTITVGTWAIPLLLTVVAWAWATIWTNQQPAGGFMGNSLEGMFAVTGAVVASLAIWLVWALLKIWGLA